MCFQAVDSIKKHKDGTTQSAIFEGEKALFSKARTSTETNISENLLLSFWKTLDTQEMGQESTRIKAAETAEPMVALAKSLNYNLEPYSQVIVQWLQNDRSHAVQQILQRIQRETNA